MPFQTSQFVSAAAEVVKETSSGMAARAHALSQQSAKDSYIQLNISAGICKSSGCSIEYFGIASGGLQVVRQELLERLLLQEVQGIRQGSTCGSTSGSASGSTKHGIEPQLEGAVGSRGPRRTSATRDPSDMPRRLEKALKRA
eukprot:2521278-Pleurochrysis_carterae.AAC.1